MHVWQRLLDMQNQSLETEFVNAFCEPAGFNHKLALEYIILQARCGVIQTSPVSSVCQNPSIIVLLLGQVLLGCADVLMCRSSFRRESVRDKMSESSKIRGSDLSLIVPFDLLEGSQNSTSAHD